MHSEKVVHITCYKLQLLSACVLLQSYKMILFKQLVISMEIWKDVVGYEGLYLVSNLGVVKGVDRMVKCKGDSFRPVKGKVLSAHPSDRPYLHVVLQNGKRKTQRVHIIVANAFLGEANGRVVDHKNGIVTDNRAENLEYVTLRENSFRGANSERGGKTSKYRGVYLRPKKKGQRLNDKWGVDISFNQKKYYIGTFCTEEEAHLAYEKYKDMDESFFADRKARRIFGC